MIKPTASVGIDSISLWRGQTLTVWADPSKYSDDREPIQIEIRVNKAGEVQIFCDLATLKPFAEWVAMRDDE